MGSGSSRLGSRSSRSNRTKRLFASIFICGASPSSRRSALEVKKKTTPFGCFVWKCNVMMDCSFLYFRLQFQDLFFMVYWDYYEF